MLKAVAALFASRRWKRRFSGIAVLAVVGALIALVVTQYHNTAAPSPQTLSNDPALNVAKKSKRIPLPREARAAAGKFILSAVRRKHLDQAWSLAGPGIRQGMTYREWMTGTIAVVPFTHDIDKVRMKVDKSTKNEAEIQVAVLPKDDKIRGQLFFMGLIRVGSSGHQHWLVNYWAPRVSILLKVPS